MRREREVGVACVVRWGVGGRGVCNMFVEQQWTAKVWSCALVEWFRSLQEHGVFFFDGTVVVTVSFDWVAKLWASASCECFWSRL